MDFPEWTLWGMAGAGFTAVVLLGFSLYSQSPRIRARTSIEPYKLEARIRRLTAFAFAALLLMMGFFLAGVPVDEPVADVTGVTTTTSGVAEADDAIDDELDSADSSDRSSASGAFNGPPPQTAATPTSSSNFEISTSATTEPQAPDVESAELAAATPDSAVADTPAEPTPEPTATATPTVTPSPTPTPKPTLTPTPIEDPTGTIATGGSTLWVRGTPGGANIALVRDGDIVIVRGGSANRDGVIWQQIMTVDGVTGWIQLEFLQTDA